MYTLKVSLMDPDDGTVAFFEEIHSIPRGAVREVGFATPTLSAIAALLTRVAAGKD